MTLVERYCAVEEKLSAIIDSCGRRRDEVLLLPVSKTVSADEIMTLYRHGIRCFAENRAAVLTEKAEKLPADIEWHFIGPLQSNKVRKVVRAASVVHSIDSADILERLDRIAGEEKKRLRFLIEVSVSGEESKGGISLDELDKLASDAVKTSNVEWCGLMTMAPLGAPKEVLHEIFGKLTSERNRLEKIFTKSLPILSMGMSDDYPVAVECGSTLVRLGSCIFSE